MSFIHTKPWALYNEVDENAAEWLENLINLGGIAPGIVDRRSISDLCGDDLRGFRQCHFFAGIGVWSYALRRSGWADDAPVWTGSCPCQPFSAAGQRAGVDDERHLWPDWHHLIRIERPPVIFGEQVASQDGLGWLDLVCSDLEAQGYANGPVDTCSAGSGAPHIRQRLRFMSYDLRSVPEWVADTRYDGPQGRVFGRAYEAWQILNGQIGRDCSVGGMAYPDGGNRSAEGLQRGGEQRQQPQNSGPARRMADNPSVRREVALFDNGIGRQEIAERKADVLGSDGFAGRYDTTGPVNGHWRDADWLLCRDGRWRPVEPGTFPLVDGTTFALGSGSAYEGKSRQAILRGYGNALDAEATTHFIGASIDALRDRFAKLSGQSPLELSKVRDMEDLL